MIMTTSEGKGALIPSVSYKWGGAGGQSMRAMKCLMSSALEASTENWGLRSRVSVAACMWLLAGIAQARDVQHVEILETGMSRDDEAIEYCKKFRPTKKQIKNFFSKAYPVEGYVLSHERYSSCYATGALTFADGSSGKWKLSSSGVATFAFARGDVVTLFHRKNRWHDPFSCTYGLSDQGKC